MLRLTQRAFPVSLNRVLPVHHVVSRNPPLRSFSLLRNLRKPFEDAKKTVLSSVQSLNKLKSFQIPRREYRTNEQVPSSDEEWQAIASQVPRLPFGFVRSVLLPVLFLGTIALAAIALANSDGVRERRRKRNAQQRIAGNSGYFSDATRSLMYITGVNTLVFLLWQAPQARPVMNNYFLHGPLNPNLISGLLCNVSHKTFFHFMFNMVALTSFSHSLERSMSPEQIVAIYIAGGAMSSLSSHLFKLITRDLVPSLGASGSVYAMVAASTYLNPDARYTFIFFPMYDFSASTLFPIIVAFDAIGCFGSAFKLFRFGFDHAAHLGGAAFGWYYTEYLVRKHRQRQAAINNTYRR
ncbi:presenilins-associated rhomboid-like protein, mitochondrial-like [Planoprotostelium fungivorum]|uniref:Presenilins-associated rhomboid-like protein, mitochondrial-like n=1 Tax=Planoprotostelium fungivorum TaxID=1890364 RepID=A0A2P6N2E9_9EUKA|nr:presenilins-associated rhomboid-like protein, mitochondrial-like [Planoprotostelium fungivorum]